MVAVSFQGGIGNDIVRSNVCTYVLGRLPKEDNSTHKTIFHLCSAQALYTLLTRTGYVPVRTY